LLIPIVKCCCSCKLIISLLWFCATKNWIQLWLIFFIKNVQFVYVKDDIEINKLPQMWKCIRILYHPLLQHPTNFHPILIRNLMLLLIWLLSFAFELLLRIS
jgi:hypothetical protein